MPDRFFFLLGLCCLLVHEMDAIRAKEWKIFPGLGRLKDETGYVLFSALHLPLYVLLLWGLFGGTGVNRGLIVALDVFFIVHVFLHLIFYSHPENRFRSVFSYTLILGAGLFGTIDLVTF